MNTLHSLSDSRPGPACAAFEPLLPLVSHDLLEPEEARVLQTHLADCAHCRDRLAAYERLDGALRRRFEQVAMSPLHTEDIMNEIEEGEVQGQEVPLAPVLPLRRRAESRPNRLFSWVGALASVLVIALIATALVASHHLATQGKTPPGSSAALGSLGIYFGTDATSSPAQNFLYALNASNGSLRWRVRLPAGVSANPALVDHGVLYVVAVDVNASSDVATSVKNAIYAFRVSDGRELWHTSTGAVAYTPVLSDGMVYVAAEDGNVYALRPSNGAVKWQTQVGSPLINLRSVADGVIYLNIYGTANDGSPDGSIIALNANDGSVKWRVDLYSMPVFVQVVDGYVTVTSSQVMSTNDGVTSVNKYFVLNASDGTARWSYPSDKSTGVSDAFVEQDTAYVALLGGPAKDQHVVALQALNISDGSVRWEKPYTNFVLLRPDQGVQDGKVYLADNHTLFALNTQDGSEVWHAQIGDTPYFNGLANGTLFAQVGSELYALDAAAGSIIWRYNLGYAAYVTAIGNQQVYGMAKPTDPQQRWALRVFALDAHTSQLLWHYDAVSAITSLLVG
jgi:outer membrane protein assembly factor BamB